MNALGILSGTTASAGGNAVAPSGNVPVAGQSGFAGMLVQLVGGATGNGSSTSGNGTGIGLNGFSGLSGLLGLFTESNQVSGELLPLLTGLLNQLKQLGSEQELPNELQQQIALLLVLFQDALAQHGWLAQIEGDNAQSNPSLPLLNAGAPSAVTAQQADSAGRSTLIGQLQTIVQQLTAQLASGESLPAQATALIVPLRQTVQSLQSYLASRSGTNAEAISANVNRQLTKMEQPLSTPSASQASTVAAKVDTTVVQTTMPLRNPVWSFQLEAALSGNNGLAANVAGGEQAEGSGTLSGNPVPVWSLFKSDSPTILTGQSANVPVKVPVEQFAEQMGKYLVKQFVLSQGNGVTEAKISLHPEHLGQLDIKLMIQNGTLTAKFIAENVVARDLLETQLAQLRTTLINQGLQVEKMEVVQQSTTTAASFFQQHQHQQGSGGQSGQGQHRGSGNLYQEAAEFEAELERTAYLREIGYGNAINVTA
jgi:flagellar hook-length control protein FliK